ncbi:hypothetical protein [Raineyella sp. W15-4]|uniref:hypothetical protein n=1 Tax=Raineyella sp. W15-4 TaxID=3081651 RepID=UPI00295368AB|nr:hypothetical protein [Raineyella sp. W15-4]WOQ16530.1 hypothetical protein R0145_15195 [Raineyella sp. W15-4]
MATLALVGVGIGASLIGPLVTGTLVANGLGHPWGFYFFAVVAVLGLLALLVVPADPPAPHGTTADAARRAGTPGPIRAADPTDLSAPDGRHAAL